MILLLIICQIGFFSQNVQSAYHSTLLKAAKFEQGNLSFPLCVSAESFDNGNFAINAQIDPSPSFDTTAIEWETSANAVCASNLNAIARASLNYAAVHGSYMPTNLVLLRGFLDDPMRLVCPADTVHAKPTSTNWIDFHAEMVTYSVLSQPVKTNDAHKRFLFCTQHQNVILNDGSVGLFRKGK